MTQRDLVIGLDSSTTACKAVVWDCQGNTLAAGRTSLPMLKPRPAWHEQPADAWWQAAIQALRAAIVQVDARRIAALCISAQRETFVVTDDSGLPLANALLWMDERCRELLPEIDRLYGKERIHQQTGKPLSANLSLGKLFWLRENESELFHRTDRVLDVHAFLAHHLTGRFVTSWGCADPMGLFDMRTNQWSQELIEAAGFRLEQFPEAVAPGTPVGQITTETAGLTGLPPDVLVVAGTGDGQAAGLGVNASRAGVTYLNLGTAVVSGTFSRHYLVDPAFRTMYSGIPDAYTLETVLLGGTYTINWFLETFLHTCSENFDTAIQTLESAARDVPQGAQGLTLVPYWNSAMNPYWDANASGIVVGWRGIHDQPHFYRAILEGIALELRLHLTGVESALLEEAEATSPVEKLVAVGGGTRSSLWPQIIADVTGKPVSISSAPEASALGAGMLAAAGADLFSDPAAAAEAMSRIDPHPYLPDPSRQAFYSRLYNEIYSRLYPSLQQALSRLAQITDASQNMETA